jgi:hypothetical protein
MEEVQPREAGEVGIEGNETAAACDGMILMSIFGG